VLGLFGAAVTFFIFFMLKVVPFILIGLVVVWFWRKMTRNKESTA
jgi:hypothetical protein